ncbi:MAG: hypothetical protein AB1425_17860, partial [Actinomycetota bacterium]
APRTFSSAPPPLPIFLLARSKVAGHRVEHEFGAPLSVRPAYRRTEARMVGDEDVARPANLRGPES